MKRNQYCNISWGLDSRGLDSNMKGMCCMVILTLHIYWPPSNRASTASTRKGELFPTNSYMTLPKGGPTAREKERAQLWSHISEQICSTSGWASCYCHSVAKARSVRMPTKLTDHDNNHILHSQSTLPCKQTPYISDIIACRMYLHQKYAAVGETIRNMHHISNVETAP